MPLANTRVIHPDFQTRHEPVAQGGMTARIQVLRPDVTGVRTPGGDRTEYAAPTVIYDGPAKVQAREVGWNQMRQQAGRAVTIGNYLVSITKGGSAATRVRDQVKVISDPDNPALVGVVMDVADVQVGSLTWQRDLGCDYQVPANRAGVPA